MSPPHVHTYTVINHSSFRVEGIEKRSARWLDFYLILIEIYAVNLINFSSPRNVKLGRKNIPYAEWTTIDERKTFLAVNQRRHNDHRGAIDANAEKKWRGIVRNVRVLADSAWGFLVVKEWEAGYKKSECAGNQSLSPLSRISIGSHERGSKMGSVSVCLHGSQLAMETMEF